MKALYKFSVALAALAPAKLFACAACYANGATINDPMTAGMNWAIFTLGAVVATVLATFLVYFIYIMRKSEQLEAAAQAKAAQKTEAPRAREAVRAETQSKTSPAPVGCEFGVESAEPARI